MLLILSGSVSSKAAKSEYGLIVGATAPEIVAKDVQGGSFRLTQQLKRGPVVLVFYRGGWCPYDNLQLRNLESEVIPFAKKHQTSVVAISVDQAKKGKETRNRQELSFRILSDPDAEILKEYRVRHKLSKDLLKKYRKQAKINIESYSGKSHHIIAAPAVYVIAPSRRVVYVHADKENTNRAPEDQIKKAILKAAAE